MSELTEKLKKQRMKNGEIPRPSSQPSKSTSATSATPSTRSTYAEAIKKCSEGGAGGSSKLSELEEKLARRRLQNGEETSQQKAAIIIPQVIRPMPGMMKPPQPPPPLSPRPASLPTNAKPKSVLTSQVFAASASSQQPAINSKNPISQHRVTAPTNHTNSATGRLLELEQSSARITELIAQNKLKDDQISTLTSQIAVKRTLFIIV